MEPTTSQAPYRESVAALAIIRRQINGQECWLARWNDKWQQFSLVGGHKLPDESFRECLIREVAEELHLTPGTDFFVERSPLAHLEYFAWSKRGGEQTDYILEFFVVTLRDHVAFPPDAAPANRWLTEGEILAGQTADGALVAEVVQRILSIQA